MKKVLILLSIFAFLILLVNDGFARAGRGGSSGFRSYKQQPQYNPQQPSQPAPTQQNINRPTTPQAQPLQKPSFFNSGLFKVLVGGLIIGSLLSLLMGQGFQFGMPGLLEILIIAGIIFLIVKMLKKSRQKEELQYATGGTTYSEPDIHSYNQTDNLSTAYAGDRTLSINEKLLKDVATSTFKLIQDAWTKNDLSSVRNLITDRMYNYLENQLEELKSKGLRNIVEILYFQGVNIVDVEEEDDHKVVIVEIRALLRDYTVDRYDNVVEGSKDTPVEIREYWAFVGKALEWKLDDIKQV
ncbi:MAG: Tim44-like domain-containing protein [Thermodesulfovibrionales bacterium]|nr:Tim44-like domain-containing protein [Thermodesulfovibrionales bacterium]